MAQIDTVQELITAAKELTLIDNAPYERFIDILESELFPIIRHYRSEKTVTIPIVDGVIDLPDDLIEIRNVQIDTYKTVPRGTSAPIVVDYDEIGYVKSGTKLLVVPQNSLVDNATVMYWSRPEKLDAVNRPTNWLLTYFPSVYLFALCAKVQRHARDPEAEAAEKQSLGEALAVLAEDDRRFKSVGTNMSFGRSEW